MSVTLCPPCVPDQKEWTVTRRLRIMPGGSYSSSYTADGEPCNLQQLQTQLRRLRVDPEGSNVVMQGDVTRIVSMSNRDRRGLIDELAGEYEGKAVIGKLDVDNNQETSIKFGVRSIPTLLLFKNGEIVDKQVGAVPKSTLVEKIDLNI